MRKKSLAKTWLSLMLAVLSLMCTVKSNLAAAETETTVKGVDVSISVEPRANPYELGEKVPVTVTVKNNNHYGVSLDSLTFNSEACNITTTGPVPNWLNSGEEATVRADALLATYEATKTVQIDGQDIDVHILAAKNTVPDGSAFMVSANVDAEKHKKNIDNAGNYEAAAIFNFSLEKDGQPQQFQHGGFAEIRVKIPAGWDAHELQMVFVTAGEDEQFVELVENGYLVFRTNHFSPYAMLDPVDNKVGAVEVQKPATSDTSVKTGDLAFATMVTFGGTAILALLTAIAFRKRAFRKTLSILFALSLTLPVISTSTADAETVTGTVTAEFAFSDLGRLQQNSDGTVVRTTKYTMATISVTATVTGEVPAGDNDVPDNDAAGSAVRPSFNVTGVSLEVGEGLGAYAAGNDGLAADHNSDGFVTRIFMSGTDDGYLTVRTDAAAPANTVFFWALPTADAAECTRYFASAPWKQECSAFDSQIADQGAVYTFTFEPGSTCVLWDNAAGGSVAPIVLYVVIPNTDGATFTVGYYDSALPGFVTVMSDFAMPTQ